MNYTLQRAMDEQGLGRRELALLAGVSIPSVHRAIHETYRPHPKNALAIAQALELPVLTLFPREESS